MDDKEIVDSIRRGRFSNLQFLEGDAALKENENYLGYLYFLLELKQESTKELLEKIATIKGGLDCAYEYLGWIARDVFNFRSELYIAESFFRLSIKLNEKNAKAWWGIYLSSKDENAFITSVKIDYEDCDLSELNNKFHGTSFSNFDFNKDEWCLLIKIITDVRVKKCSDIKSFLFIAYCYVGRFEDGAELIDDIYFAEVGVLRRYLNSGFLSYESTISKVIGFQLDEFLENDYTLIFNEFMRRNSIGKLDVGKSEVIEAAFRAKKYSGVIELYNTDWKESPSILNMDCKIYYLLSQIALNVFYDRDIYDLVNSKADDGVLKKILEVKIKIFQLESILLDNCNLESPITVWKPYQEVERLLEDSEIITHYLYDELYLELSDLEIRWEHKHSNYNFDEKSFGFDISELSYKDFIAVCHYGIDNKLYDEVIVKVKAYHKEHEATIPTYNMLGVCYDRKQEHELACESYLFAMQIMDKCKDYDDIVISNYLSSSNKMDKDITTKDYNYWREKLNLSLVESFQWGIRLSIKNNSLYKYSPLNLNTLDSLVNKYFYLPQKNQLNDPIEMPSISNVGSEHFIDSDYRICSFSKNNNSMLMWSHYTDNHQGIMVEYEFGEGLPSGFGISEVKYTNGEKRNVEKDKYIFNQYLLTKNKEWQYEEEVRLLSYKLNKIYYDRYQYPNPDRSKLNARVIGITLGCNFPDSKIDFIKKIIIDINRTRSEAKIYLKRAKVSENNLFSLDYDFLEI